VERLLAARPLTLAPRMAVSPAATATRYRFAIANREDDREIRRLLRDAIFPGDVRISLEREPDALSGGAIEGDVHQTIVARQRATSAIAAIATRSVRQRFVNGHPEPVGYLSQLRIASDYRRHRRLVDAGFEYCRQLHEDGAARVYLASVVSDNAAALRLLARRAALWPRFLPVATLTTLAIPVHQGCETSFRPRVAQSSDDIREAIACLIRNGSRYQFSPVWGPESFDGSVPGLSGSTLRVVERSGRVVGCAALWDQRACRQVVVRGYCRTLAISRWLVNATARWTGTPALPPVGRRLEFGYLSHLAVDDDDRDVACALIGGVCELARARGLDYVAVGLPAEAALTAAVRSRFRHRAYQSVLHVAFWPDGEEIVNRLDGRPYLPELGTL
jgi:hypothetical protein